MNHLTVVQNFTSLCLTLYNLLSFKLYSEPLPNPSISLQVTDDNQILISWEQNDHPEPITAQYVYIEPVGPNHFVPSHCPINNEVIVMDIDPDMTSYLFDANPSFEYKIHVEIHFERLGMATSDIGTIITNEYSKLSISIFLIHKFHLTFKLIFQCQEIWKYSHRMNLHPL